MKAYFVEGAHIGDVATLQRVGESIGLDAEAVRQVLNSQEYADAVRGDELAAQQLGINGVPFFVLDDKYGISGAQPVELLTQALEQAWNEREQEVPGVAAEGDSYSI